MSETDRKHEVADARSEPGELSFEARIGDGATRVWMRTDPERPTNPEAVLPACLMPAMRFGGELDLPVSISARLLRNQREFQAIQRAWSYGWGFGDPPLEEVEVLAEPGQPPAPPEEGRVAAFFSGGVDSWSTVLDHPEITDLIFVRGIDLVLGAPHQAELADRVEARIRDTAERLGRRLHAVETNLRQLSEPLVRWESFYGCALVTVALFLAPRFERVLLAGDTDFETQFPMGANRLVDQLWSTEQLEIVDDGGRYSRVERTRQIAGDPLVQQTLRVCWENPDGAYNCGRCRKCLMTMLTLEAVGARTSVATFPPELDLEAIGAIEVNHEILMVLWEDLLDEIRLGGRADLEPVVEAVIDRAKRRLGLPAGYRVRNRPGPPPLRRQGPLRRLRARLRR
jgi:hypothetical protein